MLTQQRLKEVLDYDPEIGNFVWKLRLSQRIKVGQRAGTLNIKGYRHIRINGKYYYAHRLVFLYMNGEFPVDQVDHINLEKDDNRWVNLREATNGQNISNRRNRADNKSGFKGVCWDKRVKLWEARICKNGKQKFLGYFETPQEGHAAYCKAADKLHGEFKNYG